MTDHPGSPTLVVQMNVFLKKALTQAQADEIAEILRGYGALAVDMRDFHPGSREFLTAIREIRDGIARGDGKPYEERH